MNKINKLIYLVLYCLLLIKKEIENELAIEYKKVKCIFYFILFLNIFIKVNFFFRL